MTITKTEELVYKELSKPFPKEAITEDKSRGFPLTSVKAQYVTERMNEVFGIAGWTVSGNYEIVGNDILYHGSLSFKLFSIEEDNCVENVIEGVGHSLKKKNLGDSYKSAQTDFISKASSRIGVANDVFKGNVDPKNYEEPRPKVDQGRLIPLLKQACGKKSDAEKKEFLQKMLGVASLNDIKTQEKMDNAINIVSKYIKEKK